MEKRNIEIVKKLPNGKFIVKIEYEVVVPEIGKKTSKKVIKYTIADEDGIINILDLDGNISGIQFFDTYKVNDLGDIIIGIKKEGREYYDRVLSHFDLSKTTYQSVETAGPFNIGPHAKPLYNHIPPTKTIEDIVPDSYSFDYGLINRNGLLSIYPTYDDMQFGNEDACIVGMLLSTNLDYGYNDVLTGEAITPICFDEARPFFDGKAVVKKRSKCGYIDRNKIMTDSKNNDEYADNLYPHFGWASDFSKGKAKVGDATATFTVDTSGNILDCKVRRRARINK